MARATRRQYASGSSAASGRSATIRSTMPARQQVERAHPLRPAAISGGVVGVAVHDRRRALRRQRRQPAVLRAEHPVGRQQRQRAAAGALRRAARQSVGAVEHDQVGRQRAISPARPPSSASFDSAAPGVSMTRDQRQVELGRRGCMPRRASRSAAGPSGRRQLWPRRSWPSTTQGAPPKRASARSSPGSFSPGAGAVQPHDVGGAELAAAAAPRAGPAAATR